MIKRIFLLMFLMLQFSFLYAGIVVLNGLTHTYKVENGKVYKGKVSIENTGNTLQSVKLFLQDFSYKADGTISYTAMHTNSRTNSDWIKLNTNLVTLKAKEKTDVFYEITIPDRPADSGSYWSVIIVEPVEDIKPSNDKAGVNITSVVRYAIQVITDYETERAKPDLKFENVKIEKEDGRQTAKIAIANNGNLYCKPTATIEIYNRKTGERLGSYTSIQMGLLPQTSKSFHIDISKVPAGQYKAVLIATDEDENAFALNVELEVKND
ncbi:WxL protein host-binding domain-containing protein [Chryseobacterium sp. MIQD13]|uniref:WxL protein host-binding domain-containing protein n=1 Tax=Chryseobacterium sp. MIQD13 TaxID=3422310 RepID=UPI003D28EC6C